MLFVLYDRDVSRADSLGKMEREKKFRRVKPCGNIYETAIEQSRHYAQLGEPALFT